MLQGLMRVQSNDNNPKFWNISLARFGAVAIAMDMARVSESVFSETKERLIGNPNRDHANVFPAARDRAPTFICYCSPEKPPELSDLDESVLPTFCLHWRVLESKLLSMCIGSASPIFSWRLSPLYISSYESCSTSLSTCLLLSFFAVSIRFQGLAKDYSFKMDSQSNKYLQHIYPQYERQFQEETELPNYRVEFKLKLKKNGIPMLPYLKNDFREYNMEVRVESDCYIVIVTGYPPNDAFGQRDVLKIVRVHDSDATMISMEQLEM